MTRLLFSALLVFHGLLHLIGFVKEWNLGSHGQLTGKKIMEFTDDTSRIAGLLWLLTALLFLTGAVLYLLRKDYYWIPAAAGIMFSQTLIIIYWQDARYGTFINIVIFIAVILAAASMHFNTMVKREVSTLTARAHPGSRLVSEDRVSKLPQPVQRWLRNAGVVGKRHPNVIRITQRGTLRSKPGGKWMPFQAVQHFSIDPPAFVWDARIKAAPFVNIAAKDRFADGTGQMLIKPLGIFTAANSSGKEMNQGTLLRYMAELAWFPQAAVSEYLHWEAVDDRQARVTMEYGGTSATGTYFFNENGDVTGFEARRYGDFGGIYRKETWSIHVTAYESFNGTRIGSASEVTWKLQEGDFTWLMLEITAIDSQ